MKNCFLSTNHHPSTHPAWVAGQVLVNSASPASVRTNRPAGDHDRASAASPSICRVSGTTVPQGAPGHPEPTREGCSLTSLLWSARKSQDWRALFFPDLRTLKEKEEWTATKREGESAAEQTSIALSSILLNWTLRSSSSVVSSSSSCSCWLSPVCAVFSQEPPMISCNFLISFFFYLQPLLF
jgi:hypothetical protein